MRELKGHIDRVNTDNYARIKVKNLFTRLICKFRDLFYIREEDPRAISAKLGRRLQPYQHGNILANP